MIWRKNNKWDEKNNNKLYERETKDNASSKVIAICSNYKRMAQTLLIIKDKVVIQTLLK